MILGAVCLKALGKIRKQGCTLAYLLVSWSSGMYFIDIFLSLLLKNIFTLWKPSMKTKM